MPPINQIRKAERLGNTKSQRGIPPARISSVLVTTRVTLISERDTRERNYVKTSETSLELFLPLGQIFVESIDDRYVSHTPHSPLLFALSRTLEDPRGIIERKTRLVSVISSEIARPRYSPTPGIFSNRSTNSESTVGQVDEAFPWLGFLVGWIASWIFQPGGMVVSVAGR